MLQYSLKSGRVDRCSSTFIIQDSFSYSVFLYFLMKLKIVFSRESLNYTLFKGLPSDKIELPHRDFLSYVQVGNIIRNRSKCSQSLQSPVLSLILVVLVPLLLSSSELCTHHHHLCVSGFANPMTAEPCFLSVSINCSR